MEDERDVAVITFNPTKLLLTRSESHDEHRGASVLYSDIDARTSNVVPQSLHV